MTQNVLPVSFEGAEKVLAPNHQISILTKEQGI